MICVHSGVEFTMENFKATDSDSLISFTSNIPSSSIRILLMVLLAVSLGTWSDKIANVSSLLSVDCIFVCN